MRNKIIAGMIVYLGLSIGGVSYAYGSGNTTNGYDGINTSSFKPHDISQSVRYWIIKKPQVTSAKNQQSGQVVNENKNVQL